MKTESLNKLLTAIVLCTLLLVALPGIGIAAAQEDEILDIYGNANEDDIIDMRDFTYTARIILWLEDETTLADANFDGDVNVLDMTQIGLIILGRESKLTLVDSADRTVTVNKPVERVTFDHIATPEVISLLGAEDRAVGRDYYTTDEILLPWISNLPVIAGPMGYDVYYETVFELDPDIFFAVKLTYPGLEDVIATLEPEIPVVVLNFFEPDTMVENIRKMRYVLNTEENGEEFIAWYEGVIYSIEEKTTGLSEEEKPQVFLKVPGWTHEELATYSDESAWARYLIGISGGINIAADLPGEWVAVDSEWLVDQNPDTVVASMYAPYNPSASGYDVDDTSVAEATRDEIMAMDVFAGGKAVEEGRVYLFQIEMSATPRFVVTQAYMAKWFQPELFEDLDPKAIHQEYLTDFMRIDYDLDEHGVFVYPEEPVES
jgi:iron complex transport system substrate-binding protein